MMMVLMITMMMAMVVRMMTMVMMMAVVVSIRFSSPLDGHLRFEAVRPRQPDAFKAEVGLLLLGSIPLHSSFDVFARVDLLPANPTAPTFRRR